MTMLKRACAFSTFAILNFNASCALPTFLVASVTDRLRSSFVCNADVYFFNCSCAFFNALPVPLPAPPAPPAPPNTSFNPSVDAFAPLVCNVTSFNSFAYKLASLCVLLNVDATVDTSAAVKPIAVVNLPVSSVTFSMFGTNGIALNLSIKKLTAPTASSAILRPNILNLSTKN